MAKTQAAAAKAPAKTAPATAEAPKESKSIINTSKYKYKRGEGSPTSLFIEDQCIPKTGDGAGELDFGRFFDLCRKNGIPEDKVAHYEGQVGQNLHGARGRARMTLGNMLRSRAAKDQQLVGLNGKKVSVAQEATLTGAAAKAAANKAA